MRLSDFVKEAWHVVEPDRPYQHGSHIDIVSAKLEKPPSKLLVNMPPGFMASLLFNVFYPAWLWTHTPSARVLLAASGVMLARRDALKARRLVTSEWYQERWPIVLDEEKIAKFFKNTDGGIIGEIGAGSLPPGRRFDRIIVDSPSVPSASDKERRCVQDWFLDLEMVLAHDGDQNITLVTPRLGADDLTAVLLGNDLGWERVVVTARGADDSPTFPARFPEKALADLEKIMGRRNFSFMMQQRHPYA